MKRWRVPHHAWQTGFAAAAISAAIALPVVLLSVGGGVSQHEIDELEHAGYEITVSAIGLHGISDAHGVSVEIDRLAGVGIASPILSAPVDAYVGGSGPYPTLAEGILPGAFQATESPTLRGLFPDPLPLGDPVDSGHYANGTYSGPATDTLLLSAPFAQTIGVAAGGSVLLAPYADRTGAVAFSVAGIVGAQASLGPTAAYAILLPLSDLQSLTGFARANGSSGALLDSADTIQVAVAGAGATDPTTIAHVAAEIQALVPYYDVSTLTSEAQQLQQGEAVLNGFYLALSSIGLSIGLVFLGLVLVRRVETERQSIGVRRAIGLPAGAIARLMGARALVLAGIGSVGGLVGGGALVALLDRYGPPEVRIAVGLAIFDPQELGLLVAAVLGLALLASLGATRAALRLSIPEALR